MAASSVALTGEWVTSSLLPLAVRGSGLLIIPSNHVFLWPSQVYTPNRTSIRSAVFAGRRRVSDIHLREHRSQQSASHAFAVAVVASRHHVTQSVRHNTIAKRRRRLQQPATQRAPTAVYQTLRITSRQTDEIEWPIPSCAASAFVRMQEFLTEFFNVTLAQHFA